MLQLQSSTVRCKPATRPSLNLIQNSNFPRRNVGHEAKTFPVSSSVLGDAVSIICEVDEDDCRCNGATSFTTLTKHIDWRKSSTVDTLRALCMPDARKSWDITPLTVHMNLELDNQVIAYLHPEKEPHNLLYGTGIYIHMRGGAGQGCFRFQDQTVVVDSGNVSTGIKVSFPRIVPKTKKKIQPRRGLESDPKIEAESDSEADLNYSLGRLELLSLKPDLHIFKMYPYLGLHKLLFNDQIFATLAFQKAGWCLSRKLRLYVSAHTYPSDQSMILKVFDLEGKDVQVIVQSNEKPTFMGNLKVPDVPWWTKSVDEKSIGNFAVKIQLLFLRSSTEILVGES
ncbi:hypothetical protein O181_034204 [Austropuccinia psidii MF-1]|uniref:Uncharacterized protein n=1 Tax=Austropuccinia psidii MF-1 TaxID=1389203 RepID=A0A9Q3D087_9BASI|nr:hypothetical protein [Austropuccinia psidii MF-1]